MKRHVWVVAVACLAASCATGSVPAPSSSSTTSTATIAAPSTSTTHAASTTTSRATTTTGPVYDVILEGGTNENPELTVTGPGRFQIALGEGVEISILSSVEDDLHVHGYDLYFALTPGEVTVVSFEAGIPGIFEAELEGSHQLVFELEVSP